MQRKKQGSTIKKHQLAIFVIISLLFLFFPQNVKAIDRYSVIDEVGQKTVYHKVFWSVAASKQEKTKDLDIHSAFKEYSQKYGVDEGLLKKIAECESGFNPEAVNGPYAGMFQFTSSSWISTRTEMGLNADPDLRFNGSESIRTAAFKISKYGTSAWPVCSK